MARPSKRPRTGFFSDFVAATKEVKKFRRPTRRADHSRTCIPWFRPLLYGLALLAVAMVVVLIVLALGSGRDDGDPAHKILELTAQDIDPETTALERNLLKQN